MKQLNTGFDKAERKSKSLKKSMSGIGKTLIGIGAAFGAISLGKKIFEVTAEFQKFEAVLTNTLGSGSAAQQALDMIQEFAAETPFQIDSLTDAYIKLTNQGFQPTREELGKLGDLASSTGKSFDQLAEAILDAQTGEFERLKEFGIKVKTTTDKYIVSFKGVEHQVDKTGESMRELLLGFGEMKGVAGAMDAISKTLGGQLSNLQDRMTQLWVGIGDKLAPSIAIVIDMMSRLVERVSMNTSLFDSLNQGFIAFVETSKQVFFWTQKNWKIIKEIAIAIATYAVVVKSLAAAYTIYTTAVGIASAATMILAGAITLTGIGAIIQAIALLSAGVVVLYRNSERFRSVIDGIWSSVKKVFTNITDLFKPFMLAMALFQAGDYGGAVKALFGGAFGVVKAAVAPFTLLEGTGDAFKEGQAQSIADSKEEKRVEDLKNVMDAWRNQDSQRQKGKDAKSTVNPLVTSTSTSTSKTSKSSGFNAVGKGGGAITLNIANLVKIDKVLTDGDMKAFEEKLLRTITGVMNDALTQV